MKPCQSCSFFNDDYEGDGSYEFMQLMSHALDEKFFDGYVTDSCLLEGKMHEKKSDRVIVARERIAESIAKDLYFQLMTTSSWIN